MLDRPLAGQRLLGPGACGELFADCAGWIGLVGSMIVECHGEYSPAHLLEDCRRGGASFRAVDLDEKPEWGFSVVTATRLPVLPTEGPDR